MKIAVVTPYDSSNFGAYLQAYCLKKALEEMGHQVIHVRNRSAEQAQKLYFHLKPIGKKEKLMPWRFKSNQKFGMAKWEIFQKAHEEFSVFGQDDIEADLYILGSDEIWNINHKVFRDPHFWGEQMHPVISYAASIGNAKIEAYRDYPEIIRCINNLETALVRDERTLKMIETYSAIEAKKVCDPTLLMPLEDSVIPYNDSYLQNNDCMLIYAYSNIRKNERKAIQIAAKKLKMKTVACCFKHDWCDYQIQCSPLQFSSVIRQCKAVITTTFHGTAFCLLEHANFASITASVKTSQLLEQCGMPDRAVSRENVSNEKLCSILSGKPVDTEKLDSTLEKMREASRNALKSAIEFAVNENNEDFDYRICPDDQCSGCLACLNRCPSKAISVVCDKSGRTLTLIDSKLCIKCGLCKKVCPQCNPVKKNKPINCYAAQRTDVNIRNRSASGGIGAVLAEDVIKKGGAVFGAAVCSDGTVKHVCINKAEDIIRINKSKYVQSDIGNSYLTAEILLKKGNPVLFTGTPCQIAGLQNFLRKDYDNLLCVDIICHGVPPMKYLEEHISNVTGGKKVDEITFRGGDDDWYLTLKKNGKVLYSKDKIHDTYYHSFLQSYCYRENCYSCPYACSERVGDITIGDFWGIDRSTLKTSQEGRISVVITNTEKGQSAFNEVKAFLTFEKRFLEEAVSENLQLRMPSTKSVKGNVFKNRYLQMQDFDKAVNDNSIRKEMAINIIKNSKLWKSLRAIYKKLLKKR